MRIKPKKGLGQNFLIDKNIQRKISDACQLEAQDIIFEIGAGRGELTGAIAGKVAKVYAIEIDPFLCQNLKNRFKDYPNIEIINQDILKLKLERYFRKDKNKAVNPVRSKSPEATDTPLVRTSNGVKVIGNIPYYITTPIIERLLKYREIVGSIFITVQKEFAKRMTAEACFRDYGSFSCFVQYYTVPKIIFLIKKTCFYPAPKVDSCFLRLDIKQKLPLNLKNEQRLFKIIRAAFGKRRKTLRNSLGNIISGQKLQMFFTKYGINSNIRPEDLALQDFINLTNA